MRKNETKIETRAHWLVQAIRIKSKQPVRFECQTQSFPDNVFNANIGIYRKKGLLMKYSSSLNEPIVLIAFKHKEGSLHASTKCTSYIRNKLTTLPKPISEHTCPKEFIMATTLYTSFDGSGREITFKTCAKMIR